MLKLRQFHHNGIAESTFSSEIISNLWSILAQNIRVFWDTCNCEAQRTFRLSSLQSSIYSCVSLHSILPLTTSLFAYFIQVPLESHLQERCDWNRTYLQETCNWNCTYKRDAIGIAPTRDMQSGLQPTRDMQLESHLPAKKIIGKNWKIYTQPSLLIQCVKNFPVESQESRPSCDNPNHLVREMTCAPLFPYIISVVTLDC
jgi:hypothetical protein